MAISSETLKNTAYNVLKQMILTGHLKPGQKLAERDLTERLRISRTPLREALSRLEQEGLVISKPQRGYFVLEIDAKMIEDLFDLREVLDGFAIRLAIRRMTAEELEELERVFRELSRFEKNETQTEEEIRTGLRIHEILARAGKNELLCETLLRLYERMLMFIWIDVLYADEAALTRHEHREIFEVVLVRDEKRAVEIAQAHVRRSKENVLRVAKAKSLFYLKPL